MNPVTPEDRDTIRDLGKRIYRLSDIRKRFVWIAELNVVIRRKMEELRKMNPDEHFSLH